MNERGDHSAGTPQPVVLEENGSLEEATIAPRHEHIVLAFFDVLGFSERVRRIGLEAIYKHYEELIELVKARAGGRVVVSAAPAGCRWGAIGE